MQRIKKHFSQLVHTKFWKRPRQHPYVSGAFLSIFLFFMACFGLVVVNAQTVGPDDIKIVDVYEDGELRSVPTRSATVQEFIGKQVIELSEFDVVEPTLATEIDRDNFEIRIFRAKPVNITEGSETKRLLSAYQEPRLIANQAGYELAPADKAEWSDSPGVEVAREIIITRARDFQINLYGNLFVHKSHLTLVSDILAEAGVSLQEGDTVIPGTETIVNDEQIITISRFGTQIVTVEESIQFETISTRDSNQPIGYVNITKPGVLGKRIVTYEVQLENEIEVSRTKLQEVLVSQPSAQEQVVGSKVVDASSNVELGRQIATEMGYIDQFDCIYTIFSRESGWNHTARNRSSGAYGIPQALPGSKMGPGWESDPAVQIRWGIGYMVSRYGSPCSAWTFWQANKWY